MCIGSTLFGAMCTRLACLLSFPSLFLARLVGKIILFDFVEFWDQFWRLNEAIKSLQVFATVEASQPRQRNLKLCPRCKVKPQRPRTKLKPEMIRNYHKIRPSQMEVAPLHRTVVISHKRRLFKNTKGI